MKKLISALAMAVAINAAAQVPYRVISPIRGLDEGTMVYLTNYDNGQLVDSAAVHDGAAVFQGNIDDPIVVRMTDGSNRLGTFILEQGTTAINQETRQARGTMLNDQLNTIVSELDAIAESVNDQTPQEEIALAYDKYLTLMRQSILDNADTPIGYLLLLDYASMTDPGDMLAVIEQKPELEDYQRVQKLMQQAALKAATMPGNKFVDFEITYDGTTKRLSDYVGKGKYVLVDFWASWCGPCMREIRTLKEIYKQHKDQGLEILGVAVWDEPADTKAAIDRMSIPWECIINAQTIPTDLYGISGIPCIILFGPDGTILSRDLQGEQLKAAIASHLGNE